jgi:hypothetical protein
MTVVVCSWSETRSTRTVSLDNRKRR